MSTHIPGLHQCCLPARVGAKTLENRDSALGSNAGIIESGIGTLEIVSQGANLPLLASFEFELIGGDREGRLHPEQRFEIPLAE